MRRHSHSFTFATFTALLSRSTPHEAKLHLLRNMELFSARPDMLTRAVAAVPWDTALALLDASFYIVKDIEPKTYSVALRKMAASQAAATDAEMDFSASSSSRTAAEPRAAASAGVGSSSSTMWRQAIKLLSRLVAAEGNQTPPSAFVDAAQCLVPHRQWEAALRYIAQPADRSGVASRALLMSVAESSATPSAWLIGLRAFSHAMPLEWTSNNGGAKAGALLSANSSSSLSPEQEQAAIEQAARVAALLVSVAPWSVGLNLLLQEPAPLLSGSANKKGRRCSFPWQAAEAILTSEKASMLLLERWMHRNTMNINIGGSNSSLSSSFAVPTAALRSVASNSCLGPALVTSLPALLSASSSKSNSPQQQPEDDADRQSSPSQSIAAQRLALTLALRSRDVDAVASIMLQKKSAAGAAPLVTPGLGRARCSAAVSLLGRSPAHDRFAALAAERCAAEGTVPLEADAVRAAISSLYHHHHHHGGGQSHALLWRRALGLASRLRASSSPGVIVSHRDERILDAKALTQLVHLCAFGDAPQEALRLVGWAKQREGLKLQHEQILTAMLFCAQHGRWQEATSLFSHRFAKKARKGTARQEPDDEGYDEDAQAQRNREAEAARALLPILQKILQRHADAEHRKKILVNALAVAAPGFPVLKS